MPFRLPDAPQQYEASWGSALVRALGQVFDLVEQPRALPRYTKAGLPKANAFVGCLVFVIDGASNKRVAVSDGAAWRYPDGTLV